MKRSGFSKPTLEKVIASRSKPRKALKRATKPKAGRKLPKRELMPNRVKRAKKELVELSHTFVRKRDSIDTSEIRGFCFDCGSLAEGQQFQAGHWIPDSVGGAILRYHPRNMHGQSGKCNCGFQQEWVKINYTNAMVRKYGQEYVSNLVQVKHHAPIKADLFFYDCLIALYKQGDEQKICDYLEGI